MKFLGNLLVAVLLVAALLCPLPFLRSPLAERLLDSAHLPLFLGITCWLHALFPSSSRRLRLAGPAIAAVAIAALGELIQPFTGRSASLLDFRNGIFGVSAACAWIAVREAQGPRIRYWLVASGSLLLALIAALPAAQEWRGSRLRLLQFPLLGDFESESELRLWTPQGGEAAGDFSTHIQFSPEHATHGNRALEVRTGQGSWAGVSYAAGDLDWSRYSRLMADFYNPGNSFQLGIRVDDDGDCQSYGQRFDREWTLTPGTNRLEIPIGEMELAPRGRKLHLQSIRRLVFFTGPNAPGRTFFLDHVRLE
jgi:hypothetical protein